MNHLIQNLISQLIGKQLPTNTYGHAGRAAENLIESFGITVNRGAGPDIEIFGWEIKTRKITATSPQTVAKMNSDDIKKYSYKNSPVFKKIKKQLRITTDENDVIIAVDLIDFDQPQIQDLLEEAYEYARDQIIIDPDVGYTQHKGYWGYFEQCNSPSTTYSFRIGDTDMDKLVFMTKTTFQNLFDYDY